MANERSEERQEQQGQARQNQPGQMQQGATTRGEQQSGGDTAKSADTGVRNSQGNLGTTQREWSGTSPQEMGEDG
jgi:hypothetical protein